MAGACPEALTDEEVMLVLCDSASAESAFAEELFSEVYRRYHARVNLLVLPSDAEPRPGPRPGAGSFL